MANAVNATINGGGLLTTGLTWNPNSSMPGWSISGLGLVTDGFLWLLGDIWVDVDPPLDPNWQECPCAANCS